MRWLNQFVDYAYFHIHKEKRHERLYNIVNIETLLSTWHTAVYEYKITDKKVLSILEHDIDDFIFNIDFYNYLWLSKHLQDHLIEKYQYNTKRFEQRRKKHYKTLTRRFRLFDAIIRLFG